MSTTFYLKDTAQSGVTFYTLQQGGAAPATATTGTGWTVSTGVGDHSAMEAGIKRAASTFGSISGTLPLAPNNSIGNGFRSDVMTGIIEAGTWNLTIPIIAVTSGGDQDIRMGISLLKGSAANGSDAVYFTAGDTPTITNLTTADAQLVTFSPVVSQVAFVAEYLFLTIQLERIGAGGAVDSDVLLRVGADSIVSAPTFSEGVLAGPFCVVASQYHIPGSASAQSHVPGSIANQSHVPGSVSAQSC